jgi:hypothetical protein
MAMVTPVTSCRGDKPDGQQGKQGNGFHNSSFSFDAVSLSSLIESLHKFCARFRSISLDVSDRRL